MDHRITGWKHTRSTPLFISLKHKTGTAVSCGGKPWDPRNIHGGYPKTKPGAIRPFSGNGKAPEHIIPEKVLILIVARFFRWCKDFFRDRAKKPWFNHKRRGRQRLRRGILGILSKIREKTASLCGIFRSLPGKTPGKPCSKPSFLPEKPAFFRHFG